ncbi:MAG: hypothetical protein JWM86_1008 [Thermoleophilia bacterium]|nr:hypothetical protein [Thermoleophilia bacterium]
MDDRHQQRIAANEARFRDMNEDIVRAVESFGVDGPYEVMCECALLNCEDMVLIDREDYDRVRSEPRWFVVLPAHVLQAAEEPVEKGDSYWVIEKLHVAGKHAEELYSAP